MRRLGKSCLVAAVFAVSCSSDAAISETPSSQELQEEVRQISVQEKALQHEVGALKNELKKTQSKKKKTRQSVSLPEPSQKNAPASAAKSDIHAEHSGVMAHRPGRRPFAYPRDSGIATTPAGERFLGTGPYGHFDASRFKHGITVTTSPILGLRSVYNAADLLYQYPSMNEDLILLQQRQSFEYFLEQVGDSLSNRAIIVLSGALEGQMVASRNFNGRSDGDVNLSTMELDILAMISRWANGYISLDYDDAPPSTGSRVENSRIYLNRGFLTIGNLDVIPVYLTVGQMYMPFGKYSSVMLTTPLTESMARILGRAAILGYYKSGFYAEAYGFDGSQISGPQNTFQQGGVNMGYQTIDLENFNIDFGTGWVSNMADSQGIQSNGLNENLSNIFVNGQVIVAPTQFAGFGDTTGANALQHRVPGLDAHLEFSYKAFTLIGEYIAALRRFAPEDLTFNEPFLGPPFPFPGADIGAMHLEADYTLDIRNKPLTFGVTFGRTWQALALNLPEYSWAAVISTSIWKNTMFGIEFRHDEDYAANTTASGSVVGTTVTSPPAASALPVPVGTGRQRNMVTFQFGAYF